MRAAARALSDTLAWSHADAVPPFTIAPGVTARSLWWDELGRHAVAVDFEPGATFTTAVDGDAQIALFVIAGSVESDGRVFDRGAFVYCPARRPTAVSSPDGSLLVVMKLGGRSSALSWEACTPTITRPD